MFPIVLPEDVLLMFYIPRNVFLDKNSKEESTNIIKGKYKLLFKRHKDLEVFIFFVLTTEKSACVRERTFSIFSKEWEDREGAHLSADCSYIDVQKYIVMNKEEVIEKASNSNVGFSYAGRVCQTKFSELFKMVQAYISSATEKTDFKLRDFLKDIVLENKAGAFVSKFKI